VTILLTEINREMDQLPREQLPNLIGLLAITMSRAQAKLLAGPVPVAREVEAVLTVAEVAAQLKMSHYRVYELCRTGTLQSYKCGKSVRVKPSAVADYLAKQGG
jgi:excisionase family DNA binding protein